MGQDQKTPETEQQVENNEAQQSANEPSQEAADNAGSQEEKLLEEDTGVDSAIDGLAELQAQLEAAQQELASQKDQMIRAQAEVQNVRRRAEQDVEKAHKFALEKMVGEILPVVDSLERALEVQGEASEFANSLREGIELTLGMFTKALTKFQIEQVDPAGEPFDPQLHQAMSMVEQDEVEPNTVVAVVQKGYTLHGRLVRPAMVMVSKAKATDSPKIDEQA